MRRVGWLSLVWMIGACSDSSLKTFNAEPKAEIASHSDGDKVSEGTTITLWGNVSDADHSTDKLEATWFVGDTEMCAAAPPDEGGTTGCDVVLGPEDTDIILQVQDPMAATGSDQIQLEVIPTGAPTAKITAPVQNGVYYSDLLITFEGLLGDEEDAASDLVASWESTEDGELDVDVVPNDSGEIAGATYLTEGEHFITLTVTDTTDKSGSDNVTINVGPTNSAPSCAITAPPPDSIGADGELVTFEGETDDVDVSADWLTVSWESDKDGPIGESTPSSDGSISFPYSDLTVNTHVISMTVADEIGATCTADVTYTVGEPPEIEITQPEEDDVYNEGDRVQFAATVSDHEDLAEDLALVWVSDLDGVLNTEGADSAGEAQFQTEELSQGTHTVSLTATDTDGLYSTETVTFSVNGLPTAPEIEINPDPAYTDDDLTVSITTDGVDPEGDALSYTYAWFLDGVESSESTSAVLPSTATTKHQTWRVDVTPDDGTGSGEAGSASRTISNTPPVLDSVTLGPANPTTDDELTCTPGTSSDADGDEVSFTITWTIDDELTAYTGETLPASATESGNEIFCTATPTDGEDEGDPVSSDTLNIGNSEPSIESVAITPDPAYNGDELTCSYSGYTDADDPDGADDVSAFAWQVNGVDAGDTDTLSGDYVYGDEITCTVTPSDGTDDGTPLTASLTISNTVPSVASVTISPDPAVVGDTLTCSWSGFDDADGHADSSRASWAINDTSAGEGETLTGGFVGGDVVVCEVIPADGYDDGEAVSAEITIDNTGPEVTSVTITPDTGITTSTTLVCEATATDADGETPTLSYDWTSSSGATLGSGSEISLTPDTTSPGETITCTATATDADGDTDTDTDSVSLDNTDPEITSVTITPSSGVDTSTELTCSATATDDDGGTPTITYEWTADTGTALGTGDTLILSPSDTSPGDTITCTATATDAGGGTDSGSDSVSVENTNPVVTAVTITPDTGIDTTTTLTCSASGTDADGDTPTVTYAWTNDTAGTSLGTGSTVTLATSSSSPGDAITCTATATDADEGTATGSASVSVGNTNPEVTSVSIIPSSGVSSYTSLTCTATATDEDGDTPTLSYVWTNDDSGDVIGTDTTVDLDPAIAQPGETITCTATATDSDGGTDTGTDSVSVDNTDPVVTSVTISPSTGVDTSTGLTCSAVATDDDGDTPTFTYAWTNDTAGTALGTGSTLTLTASTSSPSDTITCTATATDADGGTDSDSDSVSVDNTDPEITAVTITPGTGVDTSTTLTCSATATDDDGDTPTVTYAWTNSTEGTALGTGSTLTLTASTSSPSDTITCTATATDADGGTDTDTGSVSIDNTNPEITAVSIVPSTGVTTSTDLTCTATATDEDGDTPTLTYVWTNDREGTTLGTGTTVTLTTSNSSPFDTISCRVTATDVDGGTDTGSDSVTVENTPPVVTSVTLSPSSAYTNDTITASVSTSDADGDGISVRYAWYVEGSLVSATGRNLAGSTYFDKDEEVYVVVTPNDGSDDGDAETSDSLTVLNTPPEEPGVSISDDGITSTSCESLYFAGYNGAVEVPASSLFNYGSGPVTVEAWLRWNGGTSSGGEWQIPINHGWSTGVAYRLHVKDDGTLQPRSPTTAVIAGALTRDEWQHVAMVYDGTWAFYLDGELMVSWSDTAPGDKSSEVLNFGSVTACTSCPTDYAFNGDFDSLRLSDSARYTGSFTPSTTLENDADTVGLWQFDDGSGDAVTDSSDNELDGDISGVTSWESDCAEPTIYVDPGLICAIDSESTDDDGDAISYTFEWDVDGTAFTDADTTTYDDDTVHDDDIGGHETWTCTVTPNDGEENGDSDSESYTTDNTAPEITSVSIIPSSGVTGYTSLTCTAIATDDDGDSLTFSYNWTNDDTGDTLGTGTTLDLDPAFAQPGETITCTAVVIDSEGDEDLDTDSVTVENTAPVVTSVSITPTTIYTNSMLVCFGSATDDDGGIPTLSYVWTNSTTGLELAAGSMTALTASVSAPGDVITCTVTATDSDGGTDSDSDAITVSNTDPVVSSVHITPSAGVTSDTSLTCSATASDTDGDSPTLTYAWTNDTDGTSLGSGASIDLDPTYAQPSDIITCTATATDSEGDTATGSDSVRVENTAPVVTSVSITPATIYTDSSLVCSAAATDDDGGTPTLTYEWSNSTDGTVLGTDSTLTLSASFSAPGDVITCTATATDSSGGSDSDSDSASVSNTDPVLTSVAITPATIYTNSFLACDTVATDVDGDTPTLSYQWNNSTDGTDLGTDSTVSLSTGISAPGDVITCTVTATDSDGGSDTDSDSVAVSNTDPVISTVSITPTTAYSNSLLFCYAAATDDDGDTPTLSYQWNNSTDGTVLGLSSSLSLGSDLVSPGDTIVCAVTATDSDGGTDTDSDSVSIDNTNPVVTTVTITPRAGIGTSTPLTCSAEATDTDGDTPTLSYAWSNATEGTALGTGSTLTLTTSTSSPYDVITCTATATDADGGTDTGLDSISVDNTDPEITSVSIVPSSGVDTSTALTCIVTATDADGDTPLLSYDWANDTDGTGLGFGSTLTLSSVSSSRGDTITCNVSANDSDGGTDTDSSSVTVENTAPEVTDVVLSPSSVYTNHTISASVSSSDSDGDTVTLSYAWYVDGSLVAGTDSTLDGATYFDKDQTVYVVVTPNDGTDDGDSATSDSLTVLNTAPGPFVVSIEPDEPEEAVDDIICQIVAAPDDDDGDSISYTIEWTVDGVAYTDATTTTTITGDTVPAESLIADEVWTCTVTPNDGDDDGPASTASTTIEAGCFEGWDSTESNLVDADYSFIGEAAGDYAGMSVSNAGDVDGDGLDDLLVGARYNDDGGSNAGKAYLMLGASLGADAEIDLANADYAFIGEASEDFAGISVSSAGDVDGDGLDDILIGASHNDDGGTLAGKAYLVLGASLGADAEIDLANADYAFIGEAAGNFAGYSVSSAGDVDDDGLDDLLIGATSNHDGGDSAGKAYLVLGASLGADAEIDLADADYGFIGEASNDTAGWSVSSAGDVDGDELDDLLIGAYANDDGGDRAGKAYLMLGASLGSDAEIDLSAADYAFIGEAAGDKAGYSVSSAGDVDGDGLDDLLVGAHHNTDGGSNAGKAYLILGASLGSDAEIDLSDADYAFIGEAADNNAGHSVSSAGDVDGDGLDDLLISAHTNDDDGGSAGKAYLIRGASLGADVELNLSDADYAFIGEDAYDYAGQSVSNAGDVDGDGLNDLLVGAYGNNDGGSNAGKAYLLLAPTGCNTAPRATEISISPSDPEAGGDDLVCVIDTEAYDAEGDSISYTFDWTVDGTSYSDATTTTEAGDTVPASDTDTDEEWTCTVTPNDGEYAGSPATDFVVVTDPTDLGGVDTTGLVLLYSLDESSSPIQNDDRASCGSACDVSSDMGVSYGYSGVDGGSVYWSDAGVYTETYHRSALNGGESGGFSVVFWIKVRSYSASCHNAIYNKGNVGWGRGYYPHFTARVCSGSIGPMWEGNGSTEYFNMMCDDGGTLETDRWYHIAHVMEADHRTLRQYIDGVEHCSVTPGGVWNGDSSVALNLGRLEGTVSSTYSDHELDLFSIWTRTLTAAEVEAMSGI